MLTLTDTLGERWSDPSFPPVSATIGIAGESNSTDFGSECDCLSLTTANHVAVNGSRIEN